RDADDQLARAARASHGPELEVRLYHTSHCTLPKACRTGYERGMDPATLSILMKNIVPVLALLATGAVPVGIVWILKSHKLRMRELDIEEKALLSRSVEAR